MRFKDLFKSTKNEEHIIVLEKAFAILSEHIKTLDKMPELLGKVDIRIGSLKMSLDDIRKYFEGKIVVIESLTTELETTKERVARLEIMHVEIFKKQNDLFEKGMETLIKESANFNRHAIDFAGKQMDKTADECRQIVLSGVDKEEYPKIRTIIVNGEYLTTDKNILSYNGIFAYASNFDDSIVLDDTLQIFHKSADSQEFKILEVFGIINVTDKIEFIVKNA